MHYGEPNIAQIQHTALAVCRGAQNLSRQENPDFDTFGYRCHDIQI